MSGRLRGRTRLAAWALAVAPAWAQAFGGLGHELVAELAQAGLEPGAAAEVRRLLAAESQTRLADVANWADEHRSPQTAAWHYLNFRREDGCRYDALRMCVGGACVVGALERQAGILRSSRTDEERLKALRYVVHLVADVHQPLHAGFVEDRGGNLFQVQAFGAGSNLHAVWDTGLIQGWDGGTANLRARMSAAAAVDTRFEPQRWAEESCRIVASEGFYPEGHRLPRDYGAIWGTTLVQRLAAAGQRLAALLNEALGAR